MFTAFLLVSNLMSNYSNFSFQIWQNRNHYFKCKSVALKHTFRLSHCAGMVTLFSDFILFFNYIYMGACMYIYGVY